MAVALLPPTATLGMLIGSGQLELAGGAALLLAVNVVCVLLAAKLVFLIKGVTYVEDHEPIECEESLYRSDKYELTFDAIVE